ncbi:MAG: glycosyltransferase family 4 protein, partial [Clostridia bacterium]|nr:glycosyltransferase family 4 protein [Clostridia bacterium]
MQKRVLLLANHFITLFAFRKELIEELLKQQYEVYLSLPESEDNDYFAKQGCKIINTPIDRRGVNPLNDLKLLGFYKKIISEIDPAIILSYTIKPNIYGAMATNKKKYKQICNITGTGATFLKKNFVSWISKMLYRQSVRKAYKVFFQNSSDRDFFLKNRMVGDNYEMIPGSGCNLTEHPYSPMPTDEEVRFIFVGRVMQVKGIDDYLKAAAEIKRNHSNVVFYIAGFNEEKPYQELVDEYQKKGIIQYLGFRKDINDWIRRCHCTVLPSYGGEGVPNVLLESAAMGRACIGSNIPGTRDVIDDGVTGFLYEVKNQKELADKMEAFVNMPYEQKNLMGLNGRKRVEQLFDRQIVVHKYM